MSSKLSRSVLSMNDYKDVLAEASRLKKPYSETGHLYKRIDFFQDLYGLTGVGIQA